MSTRTTPSPVSMGPWATTGAEHRAARSGRALTLVSVALLGSIPFIQNYLWMAWPAFALTLVTALLMRQHRAAQVALVATALAGVMQVPALKVASLPLVLSLLVYGAAVLVYPALRRSIDWFRRGRLSRRTVWEIVGIALLSSGALLAWHALARPDVGPLKAMFGGMPVWGLLLAGLLLPLLNATVEEFVFRGVVMSALESVVAVPLLVNLLQAACFGLLHKDGFPSGAWGIALATLYAFLLGLLRQRTGGLLAPWIAHVVADVTIFCIVVKLAGVA